MPSTRKAESRRAERERMLARTIIVRDTLGGIRKREGRVRHRYKGETVEADGKTGEQRSVAMALFYHQGPVSPERRGNKIAK